MDQPLRSWTGNVPFINAIQEKGSSREEWNAVSGISFRDDAGALQFCHAGASTGSNPIADMTSRLTENAQHVRASVRALHRFKPTIDGELGFEKGDIITVLAHESEYDNWWHGELNGQRGIFPIYYVVSSARSAA